MRCICEGRPSCLDAWSGILESRRKLQEVADTASSHALGEVEARWKRDRWDNSDGEAAAWLIAAEQAHSAALAARAPFWAAAVPHGRGHVVRDVVKPRGSSPLHLSCPLFECGCGSVCGGVTLCGVSCVRRLMCAGCCHCDPGRDGTSRIPRTRTLKGRLLINWPHARRARFTGILSICEVDEPEFQFRQNHEQIQESPLMRKSGKEWRASRTRMACSNQIQGSSR